MSGLLEAGAVLPMGVAGARAAGVAGVGSEAGGAACAGGAVDVSGAPGAKGAEGAGGVDVLTARIYAHPALGERVVVRLVAEAVGPSEDLALEYLGFEGRAAEPVGRVKAQSLGFPAWALVNDPAKGHHALAVVKEMERLSRLVGSKPGHAKDGFDDIGRRLDRSVPHFLPTYYEQVARLFLAADSRQQASAFFGKARAAEQRHALTVDEERLREVFLEFAGAGALSGKALREHAKGLATRLSAGEAFTQFRTLCLERVAAGLAPYAGQLEDLRRLAKAAGQDPVAEERSLLIELLPSGALNRAAPGFWRAALPSLTEVARADRAVRVRLLGLLPAVGGDHPEEFDAAWLALLDECGAIDELAEGAVSAAQWLTDWARHRGRGWRYARRLPEELALVERLAGRLVTDGVPVRLVTDTYRGESSPDLLDACLAAGVPVAAPPARVRYLELGTWLSDEREGRRDLAALAADPRFAPLLRAAVEDLANSYGAGDHLGLVLEYPALREVLAGWFEERAQSLAVPFGLPELDAQLGRLSKLSSPSLLAVAPEAVARIGAVSPAPALARTLRAGLFDELGWPALEQALPGIGKVDPAAASGQRHPMDNQWYRTADAWPALIVRVDTRVAAVGPDGVLDTRTLKLPASKAWGQPTVRYVDGQWLVASGYGADRRASWSGRPTEVFKPAGELDDQYAPGFASLALADGSRCFGGRPVHAGDTSFAAERRAVASDGISLWVLHENQWWEYDAASARRGRRSVPAFFESAREGAAGQELTPVEHACRLLPALPGLEASPFGSKDGLLGWWVRYDAKARTYTACSVDGSRSPAVPVVSDGTELRHAWRSTPLPPMRLPGGSGGESGSALHPRVSAAGRHSQVELYDAEGVLLARLEEGSRGGAHAAGTPLVPPVDHWHALRPRDERGSTALRAVTDADAEALLAAVAGGTGPAEAVAAVLPEITHAGLVAGVAGLVGEAVRHGERLGVLSERAARQAGEAAAPVVRHAKDGVLTTAFHGLLGNGGFSYGYRGSGESTTTTVMDQVGALAAVLNGSAAARTRRAAPAAGGSGILWRTLFGDGLAAVALRAASPRTGEAERLALTEFLGAALGVGPGTGDDAVLADPRGRLRSLELCSDAESGPGAVGEVHQDGDRLLFIAESQWTHNQRRRHWAAVEFDPAGRFGDWKGFDIHSADTHGSADDPVRGPALRRLVELVGERGPLPLRPEQVREFAAATGIGTSSALLLLLGLPGLNGYGREWLLSAEWLEPFGLKAAQATIAQESMERLERADRRRFTALLVPREAGAVEQLWERGFDLEPLVREWIAARGRQRPVPDELVARAKREGLDPDALRLTLNPELDARLRGRTVQRVVDGALEAEEPGRLLRVDILDGHVACLRWLAYRLPYGDPLRAVLPVTVRMLRERLADPELLLCLHVGWSSSGKESPAKQLREMYGLPESGGQDAEGLTPAGPALVLAPQQYGGESRESVWLRAAAVLEDGWDGHPAVKLVAAAGEQTLLTGLRFVLSEEMTRMVADEPTRAGGAVAAGGPAGAEDGPARAVGRAPQDPGVCAPRLVREAASRSGVSQDAATLYLMLLALPDPADRNQAEWTGWKPARLKKARAELAATGLVVEAKRARAGRSLFLPGGWLEQQAPRLPLESWKGSLLPMRTDGFLSPDRAVAELYAQAWGRVVAGDAPGFEEFVGRAGRKGGAR